MWVLLPGQDLNLECEYQKLVCYQLHHRVFRNLFPYLKGRGRAFSPVMDPAGGLNWTCRITSSPSRDYSRRPLRQGSLV